MGLKFSRRSKAFSLLELIIAIAILSTGIVVVLQALSFSARSTGLSCDIINAVFLMKDKLQELEFKEKHNLLNKEPDTTSFDAGKFQAQATLKLLPDLKLYSLSLVAKWQRANRQASINLNTYLRQ